MQVQAPLEGPANSIDAVPVSNWGGLLSLSDIINMYRRNWLVVVGIVAACTALALVAAFYLPKSYVSTARIQIDPGRQQDILQKDPAADNNFQSNQARVDTQVQVMQSQQLAEAVTRVLHLDKDPEYAPRGDVTFANNDERVAAVARSVGKHLAVRRNGTSFIIDLSFTSHDPEKSTRIANAFAQGFVELSAQSSSQSSGQTADFLQKQMTALNGQIEDKESRLAQYKARAGIAQSGDAQTVTDQQIGPVSAQLANAEATASKANADLAAGERQVASGNLQSVSGVLNSTVITQLRAQRAQLGAQAAELNKRYGPNYPQRIEVQEQIDSVDGMIQAEANRIVSRLRADAQAANQALAQLRGVLGGLKSQQASNVSAAVNAQKLEREIAADRDVYERAAQQAQQQGQQAAAQQPVGSLIQPAVTPSLPAFPNTRLFLLAGLFSGLLLGSITVFALDMFRQGLRSPEQIRAMGLHYLASIPTLTPAQMKIVKNAGLPAAGYVVERPLSSVAEVFRVLRVDMESQPIPGNRGRIITIVSSLPGEGKSFISYSIAQVAAQDGVRALLIDCDRRRPQISGMLGDHVSLGLDDVLAGKATVEQAIVTDPSTGLAILPWRVAATSAQDIYAQPEFQEMLHRLAAHYELVVVDSPPVLGVSDARRLAALADSTILAIRWEKTPEGAVAAAIEQLGHDQVRLAGAAFSQVNAKAFASLSKLDPIYYQNKYSSYYHD